MFDSGYRELRGEGALVMGFLPLSRGLCSSALRMGCSERGLLANSRSAAFWGLAIAVVPSRLCS